VGATLLFITLFPSVSFGQEVRATVRGGVARPGTYTVPTVSRLSSLIEKAGGYADNALLAGAILTRKTLIDTQKATLREHISRVEAEALAAPDDEGAKRAFLDSLKRLDPTGRMPIRLMHLRLLKGGGHDFPLEDGDTLEIPVDKMPVTVAGDVRNRDRSTSPHSGKSDFNDYIRLAGGFSEEADRDNVYLLKGGATAILLSQQWIRWDAAHSRWEFTAFRGDVARIEPGDTIVVPKKPAPGSWARNVRGLPRLLMEIHALTGVRVETP
jgi:protein involved in polysaccharide export with SLBB domain